MIQLLLKKFDEQKSEIKKINSNFNTKFEEVKDEIKQQNFNFNQHINEIRTRCDQIKEQIIESVSQKFDKQNARVDDIINNFKINKVDDNCEIKWE